ncbi:hypothetical protein BpHYR1_011283 [Brachionus plicatilis]|uniref:Uncharacterized protein n=1 Tax=Brachionus plicatilis TaxID=10195 RepID=A0A3M7QSK9_BRAPC|nr:hypothetical protein BpHYR1_011283 [Brachionus plicatilis]
MNVLMMLNSIDRIRHSFNLVLLLEVKAVRADEDPAAPLWLKLNEFRFDILTWLVRGIERTTSLKNLILAIIIYGHIRTV